MDWLSNSDPQNVVMWLDGSAKSGKSAICYTVAQICMGRHILSGSFSFPPDGNHVVTRLIATLIYQLLLNIPETRNIIAEKIALDISILDRSWETQLDKLLIQPLVAVTQSGVLQDDQRGPRLFIIDGLDKCDEKTRCFVIETLTAALEKIPKSIPHKLLFASRSESRLVSTCRKPPIATRMLRLHLDDSLDPSNGSTRLPELSPVKSFMDLWGNLSVLQLELNERRAEADKLEMRRLELDEREEEIRKKEEEWKKKEEEWKKNEGEMRKIQIVKDLQRLPHPATRRRELPIPLPLPLSVARERSLSFEIFAPVGSIDPFATESAATVAMNMVQNSVASQAMNGGLFQPSLPFDDATVQSWQSLTNPDSWNDISMPGKHCLYLQIFGPNLSPLNSDVGFNWMTRFQKNLGMDLSGVNASYDDDNVFMTGPTKH